MRLEFRHAAYKYSLQIYNQAVYVNKLTDKQFSLTPIIVVLMRKGISDGQ